MILSAFWKRLLAIALTLVLNGLVWLVSFNLVGVFFNRQLPAFVTITLSIMLFGIGFGQFLYLIPVSLLLIIKRQFAWLQGVLMGAVLTTSINVGFWLIVNPFK